ncbi:Mak10 subunit, NatC N-terminal acetyltransferase-domain-containing protein [Baffinella frigidus]|nr:Mak10 subunit, NatC N-terminal acetyltransferase-domain-containing protein [Cryptophyta sp. CCMP2293]
MMEDGSQWVDITHTLKAAAQELGEGNMLHADSFALGDSMSALEMMDPKMDAGLLNPTVIPADEVLEKKILPLDPDLETTVAIIDKVLALEMTWVRGTAIVQTLFTCLYCHCPNDVVGEPLKLYLQMLLKGCDSTKKTVSKASVYEEEDFSVNMGGYALCEQVGDDEIAARMSALEETLHKSLKEAKVRGGVEGAAEAKWTEALLARLVLRKAYYATLGHLGKGIKGLRAARKSIAYALAQLPVIEETRGYDASRIAAAAFQPELNMKLMAPSPPRAVNILSIDDAYSELRVLLTQLDTLCRRVPQVASVEQLEALLYSYTSTPPYPGAVPRSFLRNLMAPDGRDSVICGHSTMNAMIDDSMKAYMLPALALERPEALTLAKGVAKLALEYFVTLCYNLGRQRRRLAHCMEEWGQMQAHADQVDQVVFATLDRTGRPVLASPTKAYFSAWLLDRALVMVDRFLELGFQLRLYAPFEFSMLYWYVDYLHGVALSCQPASFYGDSPDFIERQMVAEKGKALQKKKAKAGDKAAERPAVPEPTRRHLFTEAHQSICRGMFRLVAGLEKEGLYFVQPLHQASLPSRFTRRFTPVVRLDHPQPLSYDNFLESTDATQFHAQDLYAAAAESFLQVATHVPQRRVDFCHVPEQWVDFCQKSRSRTAGSRKILAGGHLGGKVVDQHLGGKVVDCRSIWCDCSHGSTAFFSPEPMRWSGLARHL